MAEEKEKGTNQETKSRSEGRRKELSQEELDKVAGGGQSLSSGGDRPTES